MRFVFDLDGTLADITHRLHFIQNKPKDWPAFFRACVDDKPIWPLIVIAQRLMFTNVVEIWSGRSDMVRTETAKWLDDHGMGMRGSLRMRRDGDYRADHIVKSEWLESLPRELWPDLVFDDRQQVVDMWRAHGIICCQVAPGDF